MDKKLNLPADYAVLSNNEMTYTEGGSSVGNFLSFAASAVGTVVLASSYIWGIGQARSWVRNSENTQGNLFTIIGKALDDLGADMKQSASNFVRDGVSAVMVTALAPLSAILILVK